jgi:hypothetical protein
MVEELAASAELFSPQLETRPSGTLTPA